MWKELASAIGNEVHLRNTLLNGQCFNWKQLKTLTYKYKNQKVEDLRFLGVLNGNVLLLSQRFPLQLGVKSTKPQPNTSLTTVRFRCISIAENDHEKIIQVQNDLHEYFQLEESLADKYRQWGKNCSRVSNICTALPGLRVLRQDPLECLISFICSSNNNISRITQMLAKLRKKFGSRIELNMKVQKISQEFDLDLDEYNFYAFPTLEQLYKIKEEELRNLGFGYRAKFITSTVSKLCDDFGGVEFLHNLRNSQGLSDIEHIQKCRESLIQFHGVGRKVADCVALFSLDCTSCIPVDTHVWQIACRYYDPDLLVAKSLTPAIYDRVNALFIDRFGSHAGWAHSVLFAAELPLFRSSLPKNVLAEMEQAKLWEAELKEAKVAQKAAMRVRTNKNGDYIVKRKQRNYKKKDPSTKKSVETKMLTNVKTEKKVSKKTVKNARRAQPQKQSKPAKTRIGKIEAPTGRKKAKMGNQIPINSLQSEVDVSTRTTRRRKTRASTRAEAISHYLLS